jgi:hypothetical protein
VGEDIVLTWKIFSRTGYRVGHAENAIAMTRCPDTVRQFIRQRQRWSRGLIEAFKMTPDICFLMNALMYSLSKATFDTVGLTVQAIPMGVGVICAALQHHLATGLRMGLYQRGIEPSQILGNKNYLSTGQTVRI